MIEVGINIPNATTIIIEDASRFGLSQLHQLRGRVGRSGKQSYCYLVSKDSLPESALSRLKALEEYSSGFAIAARGVYAVHEEFGPRVTGIVRLIAELDREIAVVLAQGPAGLAAGESRLPAGFQASRFIAGQGSGFAYWAAGEKPKIYLGKAEIPLENCRLRARPSSARMHLAHPSQRADPGIASCLPLFPMQKRIPLLFHNLRACLAIKGGKKGDSDNFPIMVARNNVNRPSHAHGSRPEP